jgi:hypothetical protein
MKQLKSLTKPILILLTILIYTSCLNSKTNEQEMTSLVEKENELLKKENELLKKEKELNSMALSQQKSETTVAKEIQTNNTKVQNIEYYKNLRGKYPYEVKLLDNPILANRLKALLKGRYKFLKETWAVESPIEINNNIFVASGCQQHNCGSTNFIIAIDLSSDILYVGVREDQIVKLYSEDESSNEELIKWANNY